MMTKAWRAKRWRLPSGDSPCLVAQRPKRVEHCHEALDGFGAKAMPLRDLARFAVSRMH